MRHTGRKATFFAAALTSRVDHLKTELTSRGLTVQSVEVPVTALVREFVANRGALEGPVVLLHIAREISHLVVVGEGRPYLARDFPTGLQHFHYHQQMGQQCSEEEAREVLSRPDAANSPPLIPVLASFASEILRSVHALPRPVRAIYLSGRGVLPGLDQRMSQETGLSVFVDGSATVRWRESNPYEHHFKMAIGLAL